MVDGGNVNGMYLPFLFCVVFARFASWVLKALSLIELCIYSTRICLVSVNPISL